MVKITYFALATLAALTCACDQVVNDLGAVTDQSPWLTHIATVLLTLITLKLIFGSVLLGESSDSDDPNRNSLAIALESSAQDGRQEGDRNKTEALRDMTQDLEEVQGSLIAFTAELRSICSAEDELARRKERVIAELQSRQLQLSKLPLLRRRRRRGGDAEPAKADRSPGP